MIYLSVLLHFHLSSPRFIHQDFIYTHISHFYTVALPTARWLCCMHSVHQGERERDTGTEYWHLGRAQQTMGQIKVNVCSPLKKY